jgi:acetyltransferase
VLIEALATAPPQATHARTSRSFAAHVMMLRDGRAVRLRAVRADDADAVQTFVRGLSPASRRNRFFSPVRELTAEQLVCVTRIYDPRDLQLLAETIVGEPRIVALAQHAAGKDDVAEFALVVDDAFQRQGLGIALLLHLARHAAQVQLAAFEGLVLEDNWAMLTLLGRLGFDLSGHSEVRVIRAFKELDPQGLRV